MGDFKINGYTPTNIQLNGMDVEKIYNGSELVWPPSELPPGQVQICDLIWTDTNYSGTMLINGGNVTIADNYNDFSSITSQELPCAIYYNFDIANSAYGLYYNRYAMQQIEPPAGFRVPTFQDWNETRQCVALTGYSPSNYNAIGTNSSEWDWNVADTTSLGSSGFNMLPVGRAVLSPSATFQGFGGSGYIWTKASGAIIDQLYGVIGSSGSFSFPYLYDVNASPQQSGTMRFVKDA